MTIKTEQQLMMAREQFFLLVDWAQELRRLAERADAWSETDLAPYAAVFTPAQSAAIQRAMQRQRHIGKADVADKLAKALAEADALIFPPPRQERPQLKLVKKD